MAVITTTPNVFLGAQYRSIWRTIWSWILAFFCVSGLLLFIVFMKYENIPKDELITLQKIEVMDIPPPEPPPPIVQTQPSQSDATPSINLVGPGSQAAMTFSDNPKLMLSEVGHITAPVTNLNGMDLSKTLNINFPVVEAKDLDRFPKLISNNNISFPKTLRKKGIDQVVTKVEIIIDQKGRAFVKKIVDPGFPEMVEVIRKAINDSRFTVPTKNGLPVQAIYLYTLTFINRV